MPMGGGGDAGGMDWMSLLKGKQGGQGQQEGQGEWWKQAAVQAPPPSIQPLSATGVQLPAEEGAPGWAFLRAYLGK
jgi:hypothetical protein